jgi:hypothetical protein
MYLYFVRLLLIHIVELWYHILEVNYFSPSRPPRQGLLLVWLWHLTTQKNVLTEGRAFWHALSTGCFSSYVFPRGNWTQHPVCRLACCTCVVASRGNEEGNAIFPQDDSMSGLVLDMRKNSPSFSGNTTEYSLFWESIFSFLQKLMQFLCCSCVQIELGLTSVLWPNMHYYTITSHSRNNIPLN